MQNELIAQWVKMTQATLQPVVQLNYIAAQTVERLAAQQLDIANEYLAHSVRQVKLVSEPEEMQDVFSNGPALLVEANEQATANAQRVMDTLQETKTAVGQLLEDSFAQFVEQSSATVIKYAA